MNVQVTPAALQEIAVLRRSGYRGAGFLLGSGIGRFVLIEGLLPLDFDRENGNSVYGTVCASYQARLQGVFFCRQRPFALEWMLPDLVMTVGGGPARMFTCEFPPSGRKPRLVALLEEEGAWRI